MATYKIRGRVCSCCLSVVLNTGRDLLITKWDPPVSLCSKLFTTMDDDSIGGDEDLLGTEPLAQYDLRRNHDDNIIKGRFSLFHIGFIITRITSSLQLFSV
ncbi:unnamed protein product [Angiostrongylus costaricensis]|uniref:DUF3778 domain-containing protein n=1 Tax=Angiostrongylus costaricensis TaxID=334426 RepID=A0A0R3PY42_ANGCS|nr:unnamed protein product [Angiostrongylus costaricensis]